MMWLITTQVDPIQSVASYDLSRGWPPIRFQVFILGMIMGIRRLHYKPANPTQLVEEDWSLCTDLLSLLILFMILGSVAGSLVLPRMIDKQDAERYSWTFTRLIFEFFFAPVFAKWIYGLTVCTDSVSYRLLSWEPLQLVGNWSYCLYLLHMPFFLLLTAVFHSSPGPDSTQDQRFHILKRPLNQPLKHLNPFLILLHVPLAILNSFVVYYVCADPARHGCNQSGYSLAEECSCWSLSEDAMNESWYDRWLGIMDLPAAHDAATERLSKTASDPTGLRTTPRKISMSHSYSYQPLKSFNTPDSTSRAAAGRSQNVEASGPFIGSGNFRRNSIETQSGRTSSTVGTAGTVETAGTNSRIKRRTPLGGVAGTFA